MIPVIAIFDVGKTNKKLFLFDRQYNVVLERSVQLPEIQDEDGFPCEDLLRLTSWVLDSLGEIPNAFQIKAINFSAYGASFVHLDAAGDALTPLYNYLKPYPAELQEKLYAAYGGEDAFALATASPVLGSLNSAMQMYRLRKERSAVFEKIKYSLHLPQYLSFIVGGKPCSEITSIGCHTQLWDFQSNRYHRWVTDEEIEEKLGPLRSGKEVTRAPAFANAWAGTGLHDSSAALIPYLLTFGEPFVLISTGTWNISMNPFNADPLTLSDLKNDCLCYLTYEGRPVKASRLWAGPYHDEQTRRLAAHFNVAANQYESLSYRPELLAGWKARSPIAPDVEWSVFGSYDEAYHHLMADIVDRQVASILRVAGAGKMRRIVVDGGFSQNLLYMKLIAAAFPVTDVAAAETPRASALGAALAIHESWNDLAVPKGVVRLTTINSL